MDMSGRKTIAFLTSGIMDSLSEKAWKGISRAARNDDVNLIALPLKYINRDFTGLPDRYEYQYEVLAAFINENNVDGLIVAADYIGCLTTRDVLVDFMCSLPDVPTVLMASRIDGYPGVTFDNKSGIKEALSLLIEEKGITCIGMIGGPDSNSDAFERKEAYTETLKAHGIEIKDSWFVEGNLTQECRAQAMSLLKGAPELQAVFCVNDATARGFYEVMREMGLEPGVDLMVFGFDNEVSGAMMNPSLSTIDADTGELGSYAYEMLKRRMNGAETGEERIPTRFIRRDSFGAISDHDDISRRMNVLDPENINKSFDKVFYRYLADEQDDRSRLRISFIEIMRDLIEAVGSHYGDRAKMRRLLDNIKSFLMHGALDYTDKDELIPYLDKVHHEVLHRLSDYESKQYSYEMLSDIFKFIIKVENNRFVRYTEKLDNMIYSMKTLVRDSLNFSYANDLSYVELVAHLDWLDVRNAYLYILEKPVVHLQKERFEVPDTLMLKAALRDGVPESVPFAKQRVYKDDIFKNDEIPDRRSSMIIMPLYFGDTVYGIIYYDLTEMTFKNGEFLTNQLGTAARMIDVLKVNNEVQKQLEDNIAIMKQHNIELDKLSKNDLLTGILNRRGFYEKAEEMIRENRARAVDTVVSYVDMNNLKIVNDRFGHDEGDFALQTISSVLMDIIDEQGIVGRIGGDEYAFVYSGILGKRELSDRIKATFENFNRHSDKPYNISVSCGFYRIKNSGRHVTLEEAMSMADRDLYIAKQSKDNKIIKSKYA